MIKYPNGTIYKEKEIIKNKKNNKINYANRGMNFEYDINLTNEWYRDNDICLIYKRPTPINVVKVDYSKGARITDAYFEKQSTTDYNGIYKGKYIDFEAKETRSKTSFPLNNISNHQIKHLTKVIEHYGIAFFIVSFTSLNKIYFLEAKYVINFCQINKRKSIPLDFFVKNGHEIKFGLSPRIPYIDIINKLYF